MLHACLHPLGWHAPYVVLEVDLIPGGGPGLTGARCREDQEPEAQLGRDGGLGRFNGFERRPDFLVGQRL